MKKNARGRTFLQKGFPPEKPDKSLINASIKTIKPFSGDLGPPLVAVRARKPAAFMILEHLTLEKR